MEKCALYDTCWPSYLTLQRRQTTMNLRSCVTLQLVVPLETGTFQDSASKLFNSLPNNIKIEINVKTFARKVFKFLKTKAELRLIRLISMYFQFLGLMLCIQTLSQR